MATIIIHRAKPFQRGDMSISIYVDGKASGTLLSNNELSLEIPAGKHELRAFSNGARGKRCQMNIIENEVLQLQVQPLTLKSFWWDTIPMAVLIGIPDEKLGKYGLFIKTGLWLVLLVMIVMLRRPQIRNMLRIEPASQSGPEGLLQL
jgi:hypothetical protein